MNRLAFGTAQLGLRYGIANKDGKVSPATAKNMLELLTVNSVDMIDTAMAYGNSEVCLGKIGVENFKVVTKLPVVPDNCSNIRDWVKAQVDASLNRLGVKRLYGLLLHEPNQLLVDCGKILYQSLEELKELGKVQKIGVSVYNPEELEVLIPKYKFDLIQVPFNLIDRRLYKTGWLQRLKYLGIEIHSRSAFLQGLLLMSRESIPAKFMRWSYLWDKWQNWLRYNQISSVQACLAYPLFFSEIDRVVVGADNVKQLEQIINLSAENKLIDFPGLCCDADELINPGRWSELTG